MDFIRPMPVAIVMGLFVPFFAFGLSADAATLNVPAEHPTIQAAVDASSNGDSILVAPGSYTSGWTRILGKTLSIVGGGRDATFHSSAPAVGFVIAHGSNIAMTGFDLTTGGGAGAAPCLEVGEARLALTSCRIHDCNGGGQGGGAITASIGASIFCTDVEFIRNNGIAGAVWADGDLAHFTRCRFEDNFTSRFINTAGAVFAGALDVKFVDCEFIGNRSVANSFGFAGALMFSGPAGSTLLVERCLFARNEALFYGTILLDSGTITIRNCTIDSNIGTRDCSAIYAPSTPASVENCIITRNGPAPALGCGMLTLTCCDVWGNADDTVCPGGADNISMDPLFCGIDRWDLQADSPCATSASSPCGLIGAKEVGCGVDSIEPTTWGGIKAHFNLQMRAKP